MEEEVLIFPSDIDGKIRDLKDKFSQSLKLLGDYMKSKIQGRGMNALNQIMHAEEVSHALKLTNFNHEEECQRLELLAAINESIRTLLETAEKLAEEEARYARIIVDAEQARIAAEAEYKKRAEQEALRVFVERASKIAEIKTQELLKSQAMGPQHGEDTIMLDQDLDENASDKGKADIIDITPPRSPPRIVQGSIFCHSSGCTNGIGRDEERNERRNEE
jgi:hypothetical protein